MEVKVLKRVVRTAFTFIALLAVDIGIYGEIFPLLGLFCGISLSAYLCLPLVAEVLITAGCTMVLFFLSLGLRVEVHFWRKLYRLENFYKYVLYVRDSVNAVCLAIFVANLVSSSLDITLSTTSLKLKEEKQSINSDETYAPIDSFIFVLCRRLGLFGLHRFMGCCISKKTSLTSSLEREAIMLHATAYIVTAVAKMLYYNTLFTYLNAVKMFHEMQPTVHRIQQRPTNGRRHLYRRRPRPQNNEPSPHPGGGGGQQEPAPHPGGPGGQQEPRISTEPAVVH